MRRLAIASPFFFLFGCSVLVRFDEGEYTGGPVASGDGDGDSGGIGDGDGDGDGDSGGGANGGTGGLNLGGAGSGGTGTGGDGSGGEGTGGVILADLPDPRHYYALDGNKVDQGVGTVDDMELPECAVSSENWVAGAVRGQAHQITAGNWLGLVPTITSTSPFTLSWWFVVTKDVPMQALLSKVVYGSTMGGYVVLSENNYFNLWAGESDGQKLGTGTQHPNKNAGQWTHVALVYHENISATQDLVQLWVNGEAAYDELEVLDRSFLNVNAHLYFGLQEGGNPYDNFEGVIDEIRVYNEVLSEDQIRTLYLMDRPN